MTKISVIMVTRNEERKINQALDSVRWADEIVVVDQSSEDKTVEIAKTYTKNIYIVEPKGYCEPDRITALSKATGEWVVCIDADEKVSGALGAEIREAVKNNGYDGYFLPRNNYIFGRLMKYGGHQEDKQLRVFKKDKVELSHKIHEPPKVDGKVGTLKNALEHYSTTTLSEYTRKLNNYTQMEAQRMVEDGIKFSGFTMAVKPVGKFVYQYVFQKGFKDGKEGFIFYVLSAFYIFLKYVKLWEKGLVKK